jgi:hypothetical protein
MVGMLCDFFFLSTSLDKSGFGCSIDVLQGVAIGSENKLNMLQYGGVAGLDRDSSHSVHQGGDDGPLVSWWMV